MPARARSSLAVLVATLTLVATRPAQADLPARPATPAPAPSPTPSASPTPGPTLRWRSLGPAVAGGRVATVAGTDADPALFFAGAAGGGVWKSTDGGAAWQPVFDAAGSQSIGAIAIAPGDPKDVWVGTGEAWPRNDVLAGDGIYHSSDGGKTWTRRGLERTSQIARILIDPRDPRQLVVAALGDPFRPNPERGIFRSTDGGATWTKTLFVDDGVGAADVARDPKHPDVLLAAMWRFGRSSWHLTSGGAGDGIYRSTDGGATWAPLRAQGLPDGPLGRIALAYAPSDAQRVYALIESTQGLLWRSDDGGETWKKTSSNTLIDERPFYYTRLVVDPHDADHLFSVSVLLAESTNGGLTWHRTGRGLHGDHHDLWISADGKTILEGNDGGVGTSRDGGASWQWHRTLPIEQFYHVATDRGEPYRICGGLQDNGSWCGPSRTGDARGILARDWSRLSGGDGTWVVPDPRDARTVYAADGGGDNAGEIFRTDRRTNEVVDVSPYLRDQNVVAPAQLRWRFNWETPIAFDPFAPHVVYTAGDVVFRSADAGAHWTPISPDLTQNVKVRQTLSGGPITLDVTGAETFDTILALAPSPRARGELWASTDDGVVQLTRDGGAHWTNVTPAGVTADARIDAIEASHAAAGTAYVAIDRHFVGDRTPDVEVTTDYGRTWRRVVHGLPADMVDVVREDPADPDVLYAGTDHGVWLSLDRGEHWEPFPAPLPPVAVRDLTVQPVAGDLIAATHGRGLYVLDDLTPIRRLAAARRAGVSLFAPRAAHAYGRETPTTDVAAAGTDPPAASISFWQRSPARGEPSIDVLDASGRLVRRFAGTHDEDGDAVPNVPNAAGLNRVAWDLTETPPTPWRRVAAWDRGPDGGPAVLAGVYTVRLHRDGRTYTQTIRVTSDVPADQARRGHAFVAAVTAELSALDDALNALDNVRLQTAGALPSLDGALAERARRTRDDAARLEATITSHPVNDQDDDFLEDLLRERVLTFLSDLGPGTPTQAEITEAAALRREGAAALDRYRAFLAADVVPLDAALRAAGHLTLDLRALPVPAKPDPNADEHARRGDEDDD
ncbi:MAG TPA: hypothetical protein VMD91_17950 [Candidatus Sulfotelmatobacter sp.]|nr:hypothetical protein [Candidatus Sulfotelmatobacter sp.]